jgi:diguanylate cyclase (GGDEF)-like protein
MLRGKAAMTQSAAEETDPGRAEHGESVLKRTYARLADLVTKALPSRSVRWLLACGILLVAVIIGVTTLVIFHFRDRAIANSERQLQNAALMVAWHVDQEFQQVELVQERIIDGIRSRGIKSPQDFERELSSIAAHRLLRAEIDGLPHVRGLRLVNANGELLNGTRSWPTAKADESDQEYFRTLKSSPDLHVMLTRPWYDDTTRDWMLGMARKITSDNGELLGIVVGTIQLSHYEDFFDQVSTERFSSISLVRNDGVLLIRYPQLEGTIGKTFSRAPLLLKNAQSATVRAVSRMDGKDRLLTFRQVPHFPLNISIGIEYDAALADWREQTKLLAAAGIACALIFFGVIVLIIRQLSREHTSANRRLALEKQRLDFAVNNMTQGLLVFDAKERIVVRNQRYLDMFNLSPKTVKPGMSFRDLMAYRKRLGSFAGDVDEYCSAYITANRLGEIWRSFAVATDGRSIQIVNQPLADGGWVATLEDITEQKRAEEKIAHLAHYDALTDLPNRVLFREKLEGLLKQLGEGAMLAVLYLDLDQFKDINDTLGHPAGDELLNVVAGRLRAVVRANDVVARLGGDEFAIIQVSAMQASDVVELAERIRDAIRKPMMIDDHELAVDTSIGIAVAPRDGAAPDQLLKHADLALYGVKADGRGAYRFFEAAMDERANARRRLETDLRQAIEHGQLELNYQPLVTIEDGTISGFEALLRWKHPLRGPVSPAEFVPVAEDSGLIHRIGEWVLRTACAEAVNWPSEIGLSVNVSPVQFRNQGLALIVASALADSGLPAHRLELEITEAVVMRDDAVALATIDQLKQLGVRIALDDFGTGYSSLSYLQRLPFDKIKIDRSFINDIATPDGSLSIVQAIVALARARNMTTTAEGVETSAQLDALRACGCTELQGYLVCRPQPASEIGKLFDTAKAGLFAA